MKVTQISVSNNNTTMNQTCSCKKCVNCTLKNNLNISCANCNKVTGKCNCKEVCSKEHNKCNENHIHTIECAKSCAICK